MKEHRTKEQVISEILFSKISTKLHKLPGTGRDIMCCIPYDSTIQHPVIQTILEILRPTHVNKNTTCVEGEPPGLFDRWEYKNETAGVMLGYCGREGWYITTREAEMQSPFDKWEEIAKEKQDKEPQNTTRWITIDHSLYSITSKMKVPGGWLYKTFTHETFDGKGAISMCFVRDVENKAEIKELKTDRRNLWIALYHLIKHRKSMKPLEDYTLPEVRNEIEEVWDDAEKLEHEMGIKCNQGGRG